MNPQHLEWKSSALPIELHPRKWSGQWDSNPRPQAWQACALAAELCPRNIYFIECEAEFFSINPVAALW